MSQNRNVIGLITITEINRHDIYNVHFPLLFSVLHGLINYARKVIADYEAEKRNRGIFESIHEFFTDKRLNAFNATIQALSNNFDQLNSIIEESNNNAIITF